MQSSLIVPATDEQMALASDLLLKGELVALPTETVYGLAADARQDLAIAKIFAAKNRPRFNPLIVHCPHLAMVKSLVVWNERAERLAHRFWPGPLTLVLPRRGDAPVSYLVSAGLDKLAVRIPNHPIMRAILDKTKVPLAAPSANRSGKISATTAQHVADSFAAGASSPLPSLILDGGPCSIGIESTIVDLSQSTPTLLRAGAIPPDDIATVTGKLSIPDSDNTRPSAPGQLSSHYAPDKALRLNARTVDPDEGLLAFGPHPPDGAAHTENLSPKGDLTEAAANLFAMLHRLDNTAIRRIAAMPIPNRGLGVAINDRLQRAAAPRP